MSSDDAALVKCPYCLAEIPAEARKCRYCGEWVKTHTSSNTARKLEPSSDEVDLMDENGPEDAELTTFAADQMVQNIKTRKHGPSIAGMKARTKVVLVIIGLLAILIGWRVYVAETAENRDLQEMQERYSGR